MPGEDVGGRDRGHEAIGGGDGARRVASVSRRLWVEDRLIVLHRVDVSKDWNVERASIGTDDDVVEQSAEGVTVTGVNEPFALRDHQEHVPR